MEQLLTDRTQNLLKNDATPKEEEKHPTGLITAKSLKGL